MAAPLVNSLTLRKIAEHASGVRDRTLYFIIREGGEVEVRDEDPGCIDDATVVAAHTETVKKGGRPNLTGARLQVPTEFGIPVELDLLDLEPQGPRRVEADAVFWSESAVEKFLVPYYASKHGHRGGEAAQRLVDLFHHGKRPGSQDDGSTVVAIIHVPTSEYFPGVEAESRIGEFLAVRIGAGETLELVSV